MFSKNFIKTVLLGVSLSVGTYSYSQATAQETVSLGVKALESTSVQNLIRTNPALAQAAGALIAGGIFKGTPEQVALLRDALSKANSPQASELSQALYGASLALHSGGAAKASKMSIAEFVKLSNEEKQMRPTLKEATGQTVMNNQALANMQLLVNQAQKAGIGAAEVIEAKDAMKSSVGFVGPKFNECFSGFTDKNAISSVVVALAASKEAKSIQEAHSLQDARVQKEVYADETIQQTGARLDAGARMAPCQILN